MVYPLHKTLFRKPNAEERDGVILHVWGEEMAHGFMVRKRGNLEEAGVDGRIILKWIFNKYNRRISIGLI
jgi:hypothetical protein